MYSTYINVVIVLWMLVVLPTLSQSNGIGEYSLNKPGLEGSEGNKNVMLNLSPAKLSQLEKDIALVFGISRGCGYRLPYGYKPRILSKKHAEFAEFSWMVAIFRQDVNSNLMSYKCGGSLIHPQVVLTAAHCVSAFHQGGQFKVRVGEYDLDSQDETIPHQERNVQDVVMHNHFRSANLLNDIALVFLDTNVQFASNVDLVCLPPANLVPSGRNCWASGWGKDQYGDAGVFSNILKKVELPMVQHNKCQAALRKTSLNSTFHLHTSFVCAGGEAGLDTCEGDGGSPLVCPVPGTRHRYQQVGIVAWGMGCATPGLPGVYVHVASFRDWIDEQMTLRQLDPNGYTY